MRFPPFWLLLGAALALSLLAPGCALPAFDPAVNDRLAALEIDAQGLRAACPAVQAGDFQALARGAAVARAAVAYRPGAGPVLEALTALKAMIDPPLGLYRQGAASEAFCLASMDNIIAGVDKVLRAYGGLK